MKIRKYLQIVKEEEIARRYFVMNSFDGALTVLGVIIGMYLAGVSAARVVIISCVGAAIAMMVSGVWGAYAAERAERIRALRELERHMLRDLDGTRVGRQVNVMSFLIALVDGISPMLSALLVTVPFVLAELNFVPLEHAYYASFGLIVLTLFVLGTLVGKISRENTLTAGLKMTLAGALVGVIVYVINHIS